MTDYSKLIARVRSPFALTERDAQEIADALEAQAKEIEKLTDDLEYCAALEDAVKDAIKAISYWSTETGKRDARIAELKELVESAYREGWWDAAPCYQHPQQAATQFESDWNESCVRAALEVKQNENT